MLVLPKSPARKHFCSAMGGVLLGAFIGGFVTRPPAAQPSAPHKIDMADCVMVPQGAGIPLPKVEDVCEVEHSDLVGMHHGLIVSHKKEVERHNLPQSERERLVNAKPPASSSSKLDEMKRYIAERHPDIEQIKAHFASEGYIVFKPEIPSEVLEGASSFTKSIWDICSAKTSPLPPDTDRHCGNYHQDRYDEVEVVKQLADNYHILAMLATIHNDEPYPFQTLNYPGTSLARTHSDWIHFASEPTHLMSAAWCALEDVNPDAGPVFYHPGTHKLPVYTMQDFGLEPREAHPLNYAKYQDIMEHVTSAAGSQPKFAVIKKGECLIWSSNLIHGGPPAKQQGLTRLSQVTHYFFKGAVYNWAPVMSDVNEGKVVYYDPKKIHAKWRRHGESFQETKGLAKFNAGGCSDFQPSPCSKLERIPKVLSALLRHDVAEGESVM